MIRNDSFYIKRISGKPYILPVGQMIADRMRGISVNETGEFIWGLLKEDISLEILIKKSAEYFEASGDEIQIIEKDVKTFLKTLSERGMLLESGLVKTECAHIKSVLIAGINIGFYGDKECLTDKFDAFETDDSADNEDLRIEIIHDCIPIWLNGKVIVRNSAINTIECNDRYILQFSESKEIEECHLNKEGTLARFYTVKDMSDDGKEILFHAIRTVFLYRALKEGITAIHSASIEYKNKAWLFSAVSGIGKSTHSTLWNKLFNVKVINGDLNLIGIKDGKAMVYGLPWCGTSETFDTGEYELGGIILLRRSEENFVEELTDDRKTLLVQQRNISPSWDEELLDVQFEIIMGIKEKCLIARLNCTADDEAATVMKEYIDKYDK